MVWWTDAVNRAHVPVCGRSRSLSSPLLLPRARELHVDTNNGEGLGGGLDPPPPSPLPSPGWRESASWKGGLWREIVLLLLA